MTNTHFFRAIPHVRLLATMDENRPQMTQIQSVEIRCLRVIRVLFFRAIPHVWSHAKDDEKSAAFNPRSIFQGRSVGSMEETLTITIPGAVQQMLNRTPEETGRDLRLYAALMLFRLGKLSSGVAAEVAGIPRVMFLDLCGEYDIPVSQITTEELRRELTGE